MSPVGSAECEYCGRAYEADGGVGRPRKYCRRSCRQRAFEARRHLGDVDWSDRRIIAVSARLASMEDHLDRIAEVVADLRLDVEDGVDLPVELVLERVERVVNAPS